MLTATIRKVRILGWLALWLLAFNAVASDAELRAAIALYEQGDYPAAQAAFDELDKSSPGAEVAYHLARLSEQAGDLEGAAEHMQKAVEYAEENSLYHQKLGEYYGNLASNASVFKQIGHARKSKASFERAVELDGGNLEARSGLLTYYIMAPAIAGGGLDKAEAQALEIQRQDPVRGHYEMARVHQEQGDLAAAEREYRAAIAKGPDNEEAWLRFGLFLSGQERYAEALELYRERLATAPEDMAIVYQLGRVASISGESLDEGRAAFERYIADFEPPPGEPGHDWASYRLGMIYQQLGDNEAAAAAYQAALTINPDHREAKKALKKL